MCLELETENKELREKNRKMLDVLKEWEDGYSSYLFIANSEKGMGAGKLANKTRDLLSIVDPKITEATKELRKEFNLLVAGEYHNIDIEWDVQAILKIEWEEAENGTYEVGIKPNSVFSELVQEAVGEFVKNMSFDDNAQVQERVKEFDHKISLFNDKIEKMNKEFGIEFWDLIR
jgi:hypothetical protein